MSADPTRAPLARSTSAGPVRVSWYVHRLLLLARSSPPWPVAFPNAHDSRPSLCATAVAVSPATERVLPCASVSVPEHVPSAEAFTLPSWGDVVRSGWKRTPPESWQVPSNELAGASSGE